MNGNKDKCKLRDFCFAADENYTMPLRVCVASLLWSMRKNFRQVNIHVLDLGISDSCWSSLVDSWQLLLCRIGQRRDSVAFCRCAVEKSMFDGMMPWHGSVATYARLLLPKILPDVKWCLYSDSDVLFVESPIELDFYCGDPRISVLGHKNPPWCDKIDGKWFHDNGLEFNPKTHICAGLLLMNLELFRQQDLSAKAFGFLRTHKTTASADQSAINHVCASSLRLLPHRWGIFCGELENRADDGIGGGGAIHYADGAPWKPPVNCTMLLGLNPAVADIWRRFAVEVAGVDPSSVKPRFMQMMNVRVRACIVWCLLLASKICFFKVRRYEDWPGRNITRETVKAYEKLLFAD